MILIHWVIGDQKTVGLTAYILYRTIITEKNGQIWHSDINIPHSLYKPPLGGNNPKNYRQKYEICLAKKQVSHACLWNLVLSNDYFTPDSMGLERVYEKIQKNIYTRSKMEQQIIPHESLHQFLKWYESEKIHSILYDALEDADELKIHQTIWLVGNYNDVEKLKDIAKDKNPHYFSINLVVDYVQNYTITLKEVNKEMKNLLYDNNINVALLENLKPEYFQNWLKYTTREVEYTNSLPIEQYIEWQEWLYQTGNSIQKILHKIPN